MKTMLTIGYRNYVLSKPLSDDSLVLLLSVLRDMREVTNQCTADYKESRQVINASPESIRLGIEPDSVFATPEEWEAIKSAHKEESK